jgi:hypothetical protein
VFSKPFAAFSTDAGLMVASTSSVTGLRIVTVLPLALASCSATARACVPGTSASPSSLVMVTASVCFQNSFFGSFPIDGGGIARPSRSDSRACNPGQRGVIGHYKAAQRAASAGLQDTGLPLRVRTGRPRPSGQDVK